MSNARNGFFTVARLNIINRTSHHYPLNLLFLALLLACVSLARQLRQDVCLVAGTHHWAEKSLAPFININIFVPIHIVSWFHFKVVGNGYPSCR